LQIISKVAARQLLLRHCMQAKSHTMRTGLVLTEPGNFLTRAGYWKAAIMIVAAVFLVTLLITQVGKTAGLEKGAELAFSRACQLLHEAEKENRNVRPLPLSLAQTKVLCQLA